MDRRELMKYLAASSVAGAALTSRSLDAAQVVGPQVTTHSADKLPPLSVPAEGKMPVAFVIGKDAVVLDFCGPLEVFAQAWTKDGNSLFAPFMVVIPAMNMEGLPPDMFDWIREASTKTDITMSVCNGAFVLAKTGLLAGKRCTAHHGGYFRFAGMFPDVKLVRGARFVEDGKFASAGGVSSGIDLALRVVERYLGTEAAANLADGIEYQGIGWKNSDSNDAYATLPELSESKPLCPLCLMDGDRSIKTIYKGKNFYFCSQGEKEFFDRHLDVYDKFVAEDTMRAFKPKN